MISKTGQLAAAICVLICCPPAFADGADEIRQRIEQWTDDFNSGRKEAACDLFSKALQSTVQGQGEADYATRCALISKAIDDPSRDFRYSVDIKEIGVEGDLGFVRLDWTLTITPGDETSLEPGMDIFRREADGVWRIVRYMSYEGE
jgi:ketosteroid isomerase-like protein